MGASTKLTGLLLAALALPALAEQWFALTSRDAVADQVLVEVDLHSLRLRGPAGEAVLRVTHPVLQPHVAGFGYRSFVATAQVDCARQGVGLVSAAYFALPFGQGHRLGADSSGREAGMPTRLLESIPTHARHALLKAACPS
jgi:hypothetical protein